MVREILIVEDEQDLVRMLEYNLRREGYQTRSAYSGQAALELVASGPVPDLILLDLMLPDMPGTEVCRQLRMEERTRSVLIVMLTAKSQETDRIVGFEIGADDYVVKPFSIRELLLRIRAILRRTRTAAGTLPLACQRPQRSQPASPWPWPAPPSRPRPSRSPSGATAPGSRS